MGLSFECRTPIQKAGGRRRKEKPFIVVPFECSGVRFRQESMVGDQRVRGLGGFVEIGGRLQIGRGLAWLSAWWIVGLVGIFGAPRPWRALHGVGDDCDDGNHYRDKP